MARGIAPHLAVRRASAATAPVPIDASPASPGVLDLKDAALVGNDTDGVVTPEARNRTAPRKSARAAPKTGPIDLEFLLVTTPSNPWGDERGEISHRLPMRDPHLGRRQARRMSRRFARIGVEAPPKRLQQMLAGSPLADPEFTDISFAFLAIQLNRELRIAKLRRLQGHATRLLITLGLILVALNFLLCLAYVVFSLTQHTQPVPPP